MLQPKKITNGCFIEAKKMEFHKSIVSKILLFSLILSVFLNGTPLYFVTFFAFLCQLFYVFLTREVKRLNLKAKKAHKLELFLHLFQNKSSYIELSSIHSTFKKSTIKILEKNETEKTDYNSHIETNIIRKIYWMVQENCFWNENLFLEEFRKKVFFLIIVFLLFIIVLVISPFNLFIFFANIKVEFIQIDKYFFSRLMFICLSSFYIIEIIDECFDFYYGSKAMGEIENKILRFSKKVKIDELFNILTEYYSVLHATPNISDDLYKDEGGKLNQAWEMRKKSVNQSNPKTEIIDCLKVFNGLVCKQFDWCIIGSAALFLQDVAVIPGDVDILTDENGINIIKEYCQQYFYEEPSFKIHESQTLKSIYGRLIINNISIDIIASLESKINDEWIKIDVTSNEIIVKEFDCLKVKLRTIESESKIYKMLGDYNRIKNLNL